MKLHTIKENGTTKNTLLDDHEQNTNILIKDALYVRTISTRFSALQQLVQKSLDPWPGGHKLGDSLHLR